MGYTQKRQRVQEQQLNFPKIETLPFNIQKKLNLLDMVEDIEKQVRKINGSSNKSKSNVINEQWQ